MQSQLPRNIMILVGGAAAGAVAMYLLDPGAGRRRRSAIAHAAHHTGDVMRDTAVSAGEKIGDLSASARRQATHAAREVAAAAEPAVTRFSARSAATAAGLRRLADYYHDGSHYLAERVDHLRHALEPIADSSHPANPSHYSHLPASLAHAGHAGHALLTPVVARAKSTLGHFVPSRRSIAKRSLVLIPLTAGGVVCFAAGAGTMYFLDPDRGRERRRGVRDRLSGTVHNVGQFARRSGTNLRSNIEGLARQVGLTPRVRQRVDADRLQTRSAPGDPAAEKAP